MYIYMSWCVPEVTISDYRKFEHGHRSTHSEQRISTQMVVCMKVGSHLKEYDVIRVSQGDVSVMWVVVHDMGDISIEGI